MTCKSNAGPYPACKVVPDPRVEKLDDLWNNGDGREALEYQKELASEGYIYNLDPLWGWYLHDTYPERFNHKHQQHDINN